MTLLDRITSRLPIDRVPGDVRHDIERLKNYKRYEKLRSEEIRRDGTDGKVHVYTLRQYDEKKSIFIRIPKSASESVSLALFGNLGGGHRTAHRYRNIFGRRFWSYFKFAFTRNPYTRLVSAYEYLKGEGHPAWPSNRQFGDEVISSYNGFSDFVLRWLKPDRTESPMPHFYPQTHFIELDGRSVLDFTGSFETLENDFKVVSRRIGVNVRLPDKNKTVGKRKPIGSYYEQDAVIRRVREVYRRDFEVLKYSLRVEDSKLPPMRK